VVGLPLTDGVVTLRAPRDGDAEVLIAGRDDEFHRWMGIGSPDPRPSALIEVDGEIVGWVDQDQDDEHAWLSPDQCNVGYHVFAAHRGRGVATRAVRLLLELLRTETGYAEATFLIDAENRSSLRVAKAVGASERGRLPNADGRPHVLLAVSVGPATS
jgi:RimJ/RimL family protein N-acetyltransferase